jgi:hypothetical protein
MSLSMKSFKQSLPKSLSRNLIVFSLLFSSPITMACLGGDGGDPQESFQNLSNSSIRAPRGDNNGGDGSDPRGTNGNPNRGNSAGPRNR